MLKANNKKDIQDMIFSTEIQAFNAKISNLEIYSKSVHNGRFIDPKKSQLIKEMEMNIYLPLSQSKELERVYQPYLSDNLLKVLRFVEEKAQGASVKKGEIFEKYRDASIIATKIEKDISSKLKSPIIISFIFSFIMVYMISQFEGIIFSTSYETSDSAKFIATYYIAIVFPILSILAFVFFKYPNRIFGVKKIYSKIDSLLISTTISILFRGGSTTVDIIPFLEETFSLEKLRSNSKELKDLAKMLYVNKHMTFPEAIELSDLLTRDLDGYFERVIANRKDEAIRVGDGVKDLIGNLSFILMLIPFGLGIYPVIMGMVAMLKSLNFL